MNSRCITHKKVTWFHKPGKACMAEWRDSFSSWTTWGWLLVLGTFYLDFLFQESNLKRPLSHLGSLLQWKDSGSHCHGSASVPESESHSVVSNSLRPHGLYNPWHSPGQNTGVDSLSFLQGIFPTQGSNPVQVSRIVGGFFTSWAYQESPRILEWVTYPFYSRFSWPRNQTVVSCFAGGFFTNWAIREALSTLGSAF